MHEINITPIQKLHDVNSENDMSKNKPAATIDRVK